MSRHSLTIENRALAVTGRFPRVLRLSGEFHDYLEEPPDFLDRLRAARPAADLFTFLQPLTHLEPRYDHFMERECVAALPLTTYDAWWKEQINDKTRNMVRKAGKKGALIEQVSFSDELVRGIKRVYDESPLRQGKPFRHYGKDFETLKAAHASYLDQSVFIAATVSGELIGFIKMVMLGESASIMQIISMFAHRDKAPTNALLAKAVEICTARGVRFLHYGVWSRRSMGDFKEHNGFKPVDLPRYFVPLNARGRLALSLKLHRGVLHILPGGMVDTLVNLRAKWYASRYKAATQT